MTISNFRYAFAARRAVVLILVMSITHGVVALDRFSEQRHSFAAAGIFDLQSLETSGVEYTDGVMGVGIGYQGRSINPDTGWGFSGTTFISIPLSRSVVFDNGKITSDRSDYGTWFGVSTFAAVTREWPLGLGFVSVDAGLLYNFMVRTTSTASSLDNALGVGLSLGSGRKFAGGAVVSFQTLFGTSVVRWVNTDLSGGASSSDTDFFRTLYIMPTLTVGIARDRAAR